MAWGSAQGTLSIGGLKCGFSLKDGVIGEFTTVDTIGNDGRQARTDPPAQMPPGFLTGKHQVRC